MAYLKKIKLVNFCGFRNFELDFTSGEEIKKWTILYGPNGSFKSSFLQAVQLLSRPWYLASKEDSTLFFRRLTYHPDYQPNYEGFDKSKTNMYMEGIFSFDGEEKRIVFENNWNKESSGLTLNEFPTKENFSACFYIDADNPINSYKFQLVKKYKEKFLDFAEAVYGFKCEFISDKYVEEYNSGLDNYEAFYTDFIIHKYNTKVHYKRMSAGERKIATMITELFNNIYQKSGQYDIVLIDNIMIQIYYTRHMKLIEKLSEFFPEKQFIVTTHSPIVIKNMDKKYLLNMERYI